MLHEHLNIDKPKDFKKLQNVSLQNFLIISVRHLSKLHEDLRKLLGSDRLLIFHQSIYQHLYIPLTNYMEKLGLKSIFVS